MSGFDVDDHTRDMIAGLRETFGVKTNAAVIRKALALAKVASELADGGKTITVVRAGLPPVVISLAG